MFRSLAVSIGLAFVPIVAAGQASSPGAPAGSIYAGISLGLATNTAAEGMAGCRAPGNRGVFCGDASGTNPGATLALGVFAAPRVSFEIEASVAMARERMAAYDQYAHTDSVLTTGSLRHSGDRSVSAQTRLHFGTGAHGIFIEPVIGATLFHTSDTLTNQVTVARYSSAWPAVTSTSFPPDASTNRTKRGFSAGLDITWRAHRTVSFVAGGRLRWVTWPSNPYYYRPQSPQVVPVTIGRFSCTVGVGVRLTGRR